MKLLRYGPKGREKPGLLDKNGVIRDLSGIIPDITPATLAAGAKGHPAGRFGTAEEFGAACAFLCSVHAGYITGQNLLMDGGQYPGTY